MNEQMSNARWSIGSVLLGATLVFGFYGVVSNAVEGVPGQVVQDAVYMEECGACHFAYLPSLLPRKSWNGIMQGLEDHFGENAELDEESTTQIAAYLEENALQAGKPSPLSKLMRNMPAEPPLRVTELPAFVRMHELVSKQLQVKELKEGFLSPCEDCHREAADGMFDKERLHPGYGPSVWGKSDPE